MATAALNEPLCIVFFFEWINVLYKSWAFVINLAA